MGPMAQNKLQGDPNIGGNRSVLQALDSFVTKRIEIASQQDYSLTSLLFLFLLISIFGWVLETALYLFNDGVLINPGVLHGPWIPIYGFGSLLIVILLKRWRNKPLLSFTLSICICGIAEYLTGHILEMLSGAKWWDYSNYAFNLDGYVCLEALLAFGILSLFLIYLLAPACLKLLKKLPPQTMKLFLAVAISIFIIDAAYSLISPNYEATNYNNTSLRYSETKP